MTVKDERDPGEPEAGRLSVVPADRASWDDLETIFGERTQTADCRCQRFKIRVSHWASMPREERAERLREQSGCERVGPGARATSGLVAHLDGVPVGWCAVEPRTAYPQLVRARVPWTGRQEDPADDGVWAVTCFLVRKDFRRRGITYALARATVPLAQGRGARALEAYPMITRPGLEITWGELHVGSVGVFADAGFREVTRPTPRRVVMRIDF
ncbi:GNAT family N-acetyltransferase [Streptomyces olivochromogenes]|uniref:GNAT family N-acetyltransferase n=1 Tax=Streptomyces olivochromogenes TaxID=1963 RepID=UPI001F191043|nr:GNAT family N-acetyltransferase [Streptomyces olivochromogenes]MCF3130741.1 GNAT family N-acetyltransferase [Streptomyces olivochromogenes]